MFSSLLRKSDSYGIMPTSNNGSKLRMQPWEAQKIDNLQHGVVIIRNILYFVRKRQTVRNALKKTNVRRARPLREGKVRKEFWLDPSLLRRAQKDLGAATEREAVEIALSLVAFRRELRTGVRALRTLKLSRID